MFRRPLDYHAVLHLNTLADATEYPTALTHSSDARSGARGAGCNSYTLKFRNTKQQQAKINPAWYYGVWHGGRRVHTARATERWYKRL